MVKTIVSVLSVVFLVVGGIGFFSDPILGIFETDALHNIVHLLSGVLGLMAVGMGWEKTFAKVFGTVYAVVAVLGFLMPGGMVLGLISVNMADNVLHTVIAAVFLYAGFFGEKNGSSDTMQPMTS